MLSAFIMQSRRCGIILSARSIPLEATSGSDEGFPNTCDQRICVMFDYSDSLTAQHLDNNKEMTNER